MEIYLEEENAIIPVKIISQPCLVSEAQTITLSLAVEKDVTFEINEEISESLSTSVGVEVGLDIIGSLKPEIASSLSSTLGSTLAMSTMTTTASSNSLYVDGEENPFGVYVNCLSALTNKYYIYYYHKVYSNYDSQELYQTTTLIEDADMHYYIPNSTSEYAFVPDIYYFPDMIAYYEFLDTWGF